MQRARVVVAGLVILAGVVPAAGSAVTPVLDDRTGDVHWELWDGTRLPEELEPIRDASPRDYQGNSADFQQLRIGENRSHIWLELELVELPPTPDECGGPLPPNRNVFSCEAVYEIAWTYLRGIDLWGPPIEILWRTWCRQSVCKEHAEIWVAGILSTEAISEISPYVILQRKPPDTVGISFSKHLIQNDTERELGDRYAGTLCRGDLFANFRVETHFRAKGQSIANLVISDQRDTNESAVYRVRYDSPRCRATVPQPVPSDSNNRNSTLALTTIFEDPHQDVIWTYGGKTVAVQPSALDPVWDMVLERNGSAVDVHKIRVGVNGDSIYLDLVLAKLPPEPRECMAADHTDSPRCQYKYDLKWTYARPHLQSAPNVHASWTVTCEPSCRETAMVKVGDGPVWTTADAVLDFERPAPGIGRWTISKAVFLGEGRESRTGDSVGSFGSCVDGLFADFHFLVVGKEEFGANWYFDANDRSPSERTDPFGSHPHKAFPLQTSSAGCVVSPAAGALESTSSIGVWGSWALVLAVIIGTSGGVYYRFRRRS